MSRPLLALALALLVGCGLNAKEPVARGGAVTVQPGTPVLTRASLNSVLDAGLGAALQHLSLADLPVTRGGHVYGYQVLSRDDAAIWMLFDVRPGDVLMSLNDGSLANPDDAMNSFDALRGAGEVSLRVERAGRVLDLKQPVMGPAK